MSSTDYSKPVADEIEDIHQGISNIRSEICNWVLVTLSVVAIPALLASLYRSVDVGWGTAMIAQIFLATALWLITLKRNKVPYQYRAGFLLSMMFLLAVAGYVSFGLIGAGKIWMLVFAILAAVLFGTKIAIAAIVIGAITTAIVGGGYVEGIVKLRVDANEYNQSVNSWISASIAYVLFAVATVGAILRLNISQSQLLTRLHEQSVALKFSQNDLERRVEQQTRELSLEVLQRKAQALELQKSDERFRAFSEASSDRVWEADEDFRFTYMSSPSGNLIKSVKELIGIKPWEVDGVYFSPEALDEFQGNFKNREPIRNIPFKMTLSGGKVAYGSYFGVPHFDSMNEFIGYRGATQDQTDDVLLRRRAQNIEKQFYDSFAKLNAGFSLWDPNDKLVMCNDFYRNTQHDIAHLLKPGVTFEEIVTVRAHSNRPETAKGREADWIKERIAYFHNGNTSRKFKTDDRWIESRPYRIEDGSTIIFQIDITEHTRVEAIKSDFVSLVSHELRTPLTSIYGSLKLLNDEKTDLDKATMTDLIAVAERNSERLLSLVNDILDLQKIVAGKLELNVKKVNINEIVAESVEENKSFAETHEVEFKFRDCDNALMIGGDPLRLKQILTNLLSNAAKFSPAGKSVEISLTKNDERAVIKVTDQGPGIDPKHNSEIFDPFVQIGDVNTRAIGGTGLGLPICKALVEEHNGTISLESEPGKGASFIVDFPLA